MHIEAKKNRASNAVFCRVGYVELLAQRIGIGSISHLRLVNIGNFSLA